MVARLNVTEEEHLRLIERKTASLFSVCARFGAMSGDAERPIEDALGSYGRNLGLAFQLIDDVLDFCSTEERLGKPVGNDLREGKITLPLIRAFSSARPPSAPPLSAWWRRAATSPRRSPRCWRRSSATARSIQSATWRAGTSTPPLRRVGSRARLALSQRAGLDPAHGRRPRPMIEREVKLRVADSAALRAKLENLGWRVTAGPYLETNTLYDTAAGSLRAQGKLLRVRRIPGRTLVAVKGPSLDVGAHKARMEHEIALDDDAEVEPLLALLGYAPAWRYDKRRTRLTKDGEPGVIELDETPIGELAELEGEGDWIDRTASALGFTPADYITASYRELFVAARGEDAGDMIFAGPA
jgi:adenylate cyclase, class 2